MAKVELIQEHTVHFVRDGKFHVRLTEGRFQNLRRLSSWPMIALFFALAWVQVDGQPWLLFSFEQHRIILFGSAFSWRELPLLSGLLILGATLLFFVAVAYGRIWCGFACPQSIWTWMFIRIEQFTEGKAYQRAKSENAPLSKNRFFRKTAKHSMWLLLALVTAITFTGYFIPIRVILSDLSHLQMSLTMMSWLGIVTGLTYVNAGLVREKICLHACPYSRFQGVMIDPDTKTVSYDNRRGEPRTPKRRAEENSGDCVDCNLCVQVCPTGIDIRDGRQASCIDCAACIDACDSVMTKLTRAKGLIRFASENQLAGSPSPILRPRLYAYGIVLTVLSLLLLNGFSNTQSLAASIQRDRGALFQRVDENTICNNYLVKLEDVSKQHQFVDVSVSHSATFELLGSARIDLSTGDSVWHRYRVCTQTLDKPRATVTFNFTTPINKISKETTFLGELF